MTYYKHPWFTIPNLITFTGIVFLIALWVVPGVHGQLALLFAYGACAVLDGIAARLLHQHTTAGERFDLLSDWCFLAVSMGMCVRGVGVLLDPLSPHVVLLVVASALVVYELRRSMTRVRMSSAGWIHKVKMSILFGTMVAFVVRNTQWTVVIAVIFVGVDCFFIYLEHVVKEPGQPTGH